jgi:hypothetical protein
MSGFDKSLDGKAEVPSFEFRNWCKSVGSIGTCWGRVKLQREMNAPGFYTWKKGENKNKNQVRLEFIAVAVQMWRIPHPL